jgi:hypothetical protein
MGSLCCLCIPPSTSECLNESMKLSMYTMTCKPISMAYFTNASHQSVCLYVYPLSLLGNSRIVGHFILYAVHIVSKENRQFFPELLVILHQAITACLFISPIAGNIIHIITVHSLTVGIHEYFSFTETIHIFCQTRNLVASVLC